MVFNNFQWFWKKFKVRNEEKRNCAKDSPQNSKVLNKQTIFRSGIDLCGNKQHEEKNLGFDLTKCFFWGGLPRFGEHFQFVSLQEEEYRDLVSISQSMEEQYGQYFDSVIPFEEVFVFSRYWNFYFLLVSSRLTAGADFEEMPNKFANMLSTCFQSPILG